MFKKMPHIKKIEIKGFKSFGPKTATILIDKGFTVLTGPNGSGKTNIVDAVLFVLGELSARRLRAESFAKLIFHGSPEAEVEKAKAAKVVIQFDNFDKRLPVDTSTVTISREVHITGQSIYRLNGRRISRNRIIDILSMAGISPTGHNVVVQGTITRMAEISPHERRKMIEGMIGIAQYDDEKAEAEEKLRAAEISIRTAMGRVDEVQKRVDDLERERNELLRYGFIQNEIKRFEAMKVSYELLETERKIHDLSSKTEEVRDKVENSRQLRDEQRSQRRGIESEWRQLSTEKVEESGTRVLEVQIKIGDIKSKLTELATKTDAGTASLEGLRRVKENNTQQLEAIKNEIVENRKQSRKLKRAYDRFSNEITTKQSQHDVLQDETAQLWANLGENSTKIRQIEQRLDKIYKNLLDIRSDYIQSKTTIRTLSGRLSDLNARKDRFASTINELKTSIKELENVQKEQKSRFKSLQQTLDRKAIQKDSIAKEITQAGKIAESARDAVVEFVTQLELAETVAGEEKALRNIEELGELGVISGVYGRFKDLIKVEKIYRQAMEAAAVGWLNSIVVKDFDAAFTCAETLKRLKLGRVKIIPLENLPVKSISPTELRGVRGVASEFVKREKRYEPAVIFVFGDTLIAENDKAAIVASRNGYRAVTVNGDLYETGGGIESGYYRSPIDFSTIIPSESAVKSLEDAVKTLQEHLTRRGDEMSTFEEEITRTRVQIVRLAEAITTLEGEITRIRRSIKRTKRNMKRIDGLTQRVQRRIEKEKTSVELQRSQRKALQKEIQELNNELGILRQKTDPARIQEMEIQRETLGENVIELRQRLGSVETELATLRSKFENVLKLASDNIKVQLRKVSGQLSILEKEVEEALEQREALEKELKELETSKEELSHSILTARKEVGKFTSQIDNIDKHLRRLDAEYERAEELHNRLQLELQTLRLQADQHRHRLMEIGCEEPVKVSSDQLTTAESSLRLMRLEVERLGAVNQLAQSHYAEQVSRYKELSVRMNELEREKQAIISFMDEIERKKRKIFMEAFNKINEKFAEFFSKLTGGGEAALKLDNPEEPFAGGMDMIVQFLGKPPIPVNGASSGERSVAAVAYIFALQDFSPAAFYLFDEVDAHLDAFHVSRLGELLGEESVKSQFLVVTLKPEMVSKAKSIYGVYEHSGVSHVVSTVFKEAA
jgi:chromosome segregation protein